MGKTGVITTTKYSPSTLFKEQLTLLDPDTQDRAIKSAHRLAKWIEAMPQYDCVARVMNIQLMVRRKVRLVFKYTNSNDTLVARKIQRS